MQDGIGFETLNRIKAKVISVTSFGIHRVTRILSPRSDTEFGLGRSGINKKDSRISFVHGSKNGCDRLLLRYFIQFISDVPFDIHFCMHSLKYVLSKSIHLLFHQNTYNRPI